MKVWSICASISVTITDILTKFGTEHKYHTINTPEWPNSHQLKIQDGGGRHLEFRKNVNNFAVVNPKSSHITPIPKSLHCRLKVNERIEYKLLSLTYKVLTTSQPSYLNSLISVQPTRSTRSSSTVILSRPPSPHWKSQIAHSDMQHPISEINSLIHSVSLTSYVSTHLLTHLSAHLYHHHHFHQPSLLHSFTPGSKPTFSTNPSYWTSSEIFRTADNRRRQLSKLWPQSNVINHLNIEVSPIDSHWELRFSNPEKGPKSEENDRTLSEG